MPFTPRLTANHLLRALDAGDYALLEPHLRPVTLHHRQVMQRPGETLEQVHFLDEGVASIVAEQEDGSPVEIGLFGREGMSGSAVLLGAGSSPLSSLIQVGAPTARAIASERLLDAVGQSGTLGTTLLRFVHTLTIQAANTAAANAHFALPERLARWLLMCHDRVDGDRLELTHEFLAIMLAVRRSTVTVTLHTLEGTGAIRGTRGLVRVLDRPRLEEIAGPSYGQPEAEYRRLIG